MAKWNGWWKQHSLGRQRMTNLILDIDGAGAVSGQGEDCVGPFTFRGQFRADGSVSLVKQYFQRHQVLYAGRNSGEGIYGTWVIPEAWYASDFNTGEFALRPETDDAAHGDAIAALEPV